MRVLNNEKIGCMTYHRCNAIVLQSHSNVYPLRYETLHYDGLEDVNLFLDKFERDVLDGGVHIRITLQTGRNTGK